MSWKYIGRCAVDSGQMMLVDPCYVLRDNKESKDGVTYEELLAEWEKVDWKGDYIDLPNKLGFVTCTGYGDGTYSVYIKTIEDPSWGHRVAELKIVFIDD